MEMTLTIAKAAENDLHEAFVWYEEKETRLGQRFEKWVKNAVQSILDNLLQYSIRYGETRVCFVKNFPYGIHYRVRQNQIIIVAVFHKSFVYVHMSTWVILPMTEKQKLL